jgi:hypothetical protein
MGMALRRPLRDIGAGSCLNLGPNRRARFSDLRAFRVVNARVVSFQNQQNPPPDTPRLIE